jgi:hypothetical protein
MKLIEALYQSRILDFNRLHGTTCLPYDKIMKRSNRVLRMSALYQEYIEKRDTLDRPWKDVTRSIYVVYRIEPIDDFACYHLDKKIVIQDYKNNHCDTYYCDTLFECKMTLAFLLSAIGPQWEPYGYCDGFPF